MTNEYGVKLDSHGYAPSIVTNLGQCAYCGRTDRALHRHEAFHGAYRTRSKALGCWLMLCYECHDRLHHHDAQIDMEIKQFMQRRAMDYYNWSTDEFRRQFGKDYL